MDEQKRIVLKIDELMSLCDQLETQVVEAEQKKDELLKAASDHLVNSTTNQSQIVRHTDEGTALVAEVEGATQTQVSEKHASSVGNSPREQADKVGKAKKTNEKFKEAVLVGAVVQAFFDEGGEPLGNFRIQKGVYFARRHMGEKALEQEFLRKAAGPYNPAMKYSGGIKIAKDRGYIREARGRFGFGHISGENVTELMTYADRYGAFKEAAKWVCDTFRYEKNEEWELLATIDYALMHFASIGVEADAGQIFQYIQSDDEWRAKIDKLKLSEEKINAAMTKARNLFGASGSE